MLIKSFIPGQARGIQKHIPHTHRPNTQREREFKIIETSHRNKRTQPSAALVNTTKNLTAEDTRDTKSEGGNTYILFDI
jgi:hypothetical protein